MSSIRLRGEAVEKRYGRVAALRGVDFEIAPGESVSILGANGAGKSSLLRILAGLSRPSGGRFEALPADDGGPAVSAPLRRETLRAHVGYVAHATLVYAELSARENLVFAARLHGRRPSVDALDEVLDAMGLLEVADRRAGSFSRGMAQRLAIARAIVHEPSLVLLDEPFTGLDEHAGSRLAERLAGLRAAGRTLILVTHDPRRTVALSDRALLLHRGRLRATPTRGETDFDAEALRGRLAALSAEPPARPGEGAEAEVRA